MHTDAIAELCERSKPHVELTKFLKFHRKNPEVLTFLVDEIRLLIGNGRRAFSFASLWHYGRWKLFVAKDASSSYRMNDHLSPYYARVITILYPEFNGLAEFRRQATADRVFGTKPAEARAEGDYGRRLVWADGTALEDGWRPSAAVVAPTARKRPNVHARAV